MQSTLNRAPVPSQPLPQELCGDQHWNFTASNEVFQPYSTQSWQPYSQNIFPRPAQPYNGQTNPQFAHQFTPPESDASGMQPLSASSFYGSEGTIPFQASQGKISFDYNSGNSKSRRPSAICSDTSSVVEGPLYIPNLPTYLSPPSSDLEDVLTDSFDGLRNLAGPESVRPYNGYAVTKDDKTGISQSTSQDEHHDDSHDREQQPPPPHHDTPAMPRPQQFVQQRPHPTSPTDRGSHPQMPLPPFCPSSTVKVLDSSHPYSPTHPYPGLPAGQTRPDSSQHDSRSSGRARKRLHPGHSHSHSGGGGNGGTAGKPRRRLVFACATCRKSKVKCVPVSSNSSCETCRLRGVECVSPIPGPGSSSAQALKAATTDQARRQRLHSIFSRFTRRHALAFDFETFVGIVTNQLQPYDVELLGVLASFESNYQSVCEIMMSLRNSREGPANSTWVALSHFKQAFAAKEAIAEALFKKISDQHLSTQT